MTIRPFAKRVPMSPMTNPPMRLPTPIPVSRKPYAACQPKPAPLKVGLDEAGVSAMKMPRLNWPTAPGRVFASRTVSWRRNCQPAPISATKVGAAIGRRPSGSGVAPVGLAPR